MSHETLHENDNRLESKPEPLTPSGFMLPLRDTPWVFGKHPPRPCPVCGKGWVPWAGSFLPCHGRCLLTEELQDQLAAEQAVGSAKQGKRLGVTYSVIKSAIRESQRRKKRRSR